MNNVFKNFKNQFTDDFTVSPQNLIHWTLLLQILKQLFEKDYVKNTFLFKYINNSRIKTYFLWVIIEWLPVQYISLRSSRVIPLLAHGHGDNALY